MRRLLFFVYLTVGILIASETVRVGAYDNPPKIFMAENGQLTGFWYDITMKIAENENWDIEWVYGSWDECLHRLENDEIDVMVDTGVTPDRRTVYLFNEETVYLSWTKIFKNKSADIQSVLDLEGKNIGGLKNSFDLEGPDGLKKILRDFQITANVSELNSYKEILSYIESGALDAGIVDKDFGADNESSYNIEPTPIVLQPAMMQYAFKKSSAKALTLKEKFDTSLKELKDDKKSVYYTSFDNFFNNQSEKKYNFPFWLKVLLYSSGILIMFLIVGSFLMRGEIKRKTRHLMNEIISREKTECDLKASESKFKGLIEFAADGILIGSHDGVITDANQTICALFGMKREEIVGLHITKMPFTEESINASPLRFDLLKQGKSVLSERIVRRKDGSEIIIEMMTKMMSDGSYQSIYRDISQRKKTEISLKEGEEKYRLLVENQNDLVVKTTIDNKYLYASPSYCRAFGKTEEDLIGNEFLPLVHPDDVENTLNEMKKLFCDPYECYIEQRAMSVNGWRWFGWSDKAILDENRNVIEIIGVGRDVTDRKNAELALKDSEEKFRTLFEESNDAIYIMEGSKFIECNPKSVEMFGCETKNDLLGSTPIDYSPEYQPDTRKSIFAAEEYINAAFEGIPQRFYWKHCRKNRTEFDAEVSLDRLIIKGKTFIQSIVHDITYRIEAENRTKKMNEILEQKVDVRTAQLKLANQELESFSYSVSHDLRAPIRHILGFSEILKKEIPTGTHSDRVRDHLNKIIASSSKMETLIDDLLNFSRTSRQELLKEKVDMNRIVKESIKEVTHNQYTFSIEWKISELPEVFVDRSLLNSVWINLIDNAIKYTKKQDKPFIEIGCIKKEKEYEFFVKDNGVGFDMEYSHKLFGVFQRLHLEKDYPGTGIGLANVRRIITRHGGKTWAESDGKTGATFYFSLPITGVAL